MRIVSVSRRGKLLLLELAPSGQNSPNLPAAQLPSVIAVHLRMTGRLLVKPHKAEPGAHTRCIFSLCQPDGHDCQLVFDDARAFGQILLANQAVLARWPFWRELGPEPLGLSPEAFRVRLQRKRALKASLLDQKVVAGIGNIYADESLFQSGLHPARKAESLSPEESERLLRAIQDVLERSIAQCGSSIRDYRDANGNAGAFQNSFAVYGRGGEKCLNCGAILAKCRTAGRATVFCPSCQN